jgi:hypothetical protein
MHRSKSGPAHVRVGQIETSGTITAQNHRSIDPVGVVKHVAQPLHSGKICTGVAANTRII